MMQEEINSVVLRLHRFLPLVASCYDNQIHLPSTWLFQT